MGAHSGKRDLTLFDDLTLIAAWFHNCDFDNWLRWGRTKLITIYNSKKQEIIGIFNHKKLNSYFLENVLFNTVDFWINLLIKVSTFYGFKNVTSINLGVISQEQRWVKNQITVEYKNNWVLLHLRSIKFLLSLKLHKSKTHEMFYWIFLISNQTWLVDWRLQNRTHHVLFGSCPAVSVTVNWSQSI